MAYQKPQPKTPTAPTRNASKGGNPPPRGAQAPQEDAPVNESYIEVTEVSTKPLSNPQGKTLGFASVTLGNAFAVNDIRVVNGAKGLFIAFAERPYEDSNGEKKYAAICCPTSKNQRLAIEEAVLASWADTVSGGHERGQGSQGRR